MESSQLLNVRLIAANDYFIRLPKNLQSQLSVSLNDVNIVLIKDTNNSHSQYCSVARGAVSSNEDVIEMSSVLGFKQDDVVLVKKPGQLNVGLGVKVIVSPCSLADWQVIQLNQGKVETTVLQQVRVVQPRQTLKIIIDKLPLFLTVNTVDPDKEAVVLQPMTELIIDAPETFTENNNNIKSSMVRNKQKPEQKSKVEKLVKEENSGSIMDAFVAPFKTFFTTADEEKERKENILLSIIHVTKVSKILRIQSMADFSSKHPPFSCVVSRKHSSQDSFIARLTLVPSSFDPKARLATESIIVNIATEDNIAKNNILIPHSFLKWKGFKVGHHILLESLERNEISKDCFVSTLEATSCQETTEIDKVTMMDILNSDNICLPNPCLFEVREKQYELSCDNVKSNFMMILKGHDKISFKGSTKLTLEAKCGEVELNFDKMAEKIEPEFQNTKLQEALIYLKKMTKARRRFNLLLTGSSGCGKTTFVRRLVNNLGEYEENWSSKIINGVSFKGKRVDVIRKQIETSIEELEHQSPSVLVLENLDVIVPAEDEDRPDDHSRSLASWLLKMLKLDSHHKVAIITTAKSTSALHNLLQPTRGSIPFRKQVPLLLPDKEEIRQLIKFFLMDTIVNISDKFLSLASGCCPDDLRQVAEKVLTKCDTITCEALEVEMQEHVPASRWGQSLKPKCSAKLEDIGGLEDAKTSLIQTLLWPSKYPEILSDCGVRSPRGVLIYGAPGTGKTLLAETVSAHTGLNMITVRGPELLSKYIGASEGNVRDLFLRAQAAKPCIIFFDEFESLAPRRGHDTTGVTDRVVNQLLTQLDGVEGLEGVWVVAASSRPDLIDPALLRPGRLDRSVHCPLPDLNDRSHILRIIIMNTLPDMMDSIDIDDLARRADGMTGADLKGVVTTAIINARRKNCPISQDEFNDALESTQPSVTNTEMRKYQSVYSRFSSSGNRDNTDGISEQRVTLA